MGLVTELVAPGRHLERAFELAEGWPASPSGRCWPTAARRSRASACRSPMRSPWRRRPGPEVFEDGARGAERFAAGEGRGGAGAGA